MVLRTHEAKFDSPQVRSPSRPSSLNRTPARGNQRCSRSCLADKLPTQIVPPSARTPLLREQQHHEPCSRSCHRCTVSCIEWRLADLRRSPTLELQRVSQNKPEEAFGMQPKSTDAGRSWLAPANMHGTTKWHLKTAFGSPGPLQPVPTGYLSFSPTNH